MQQVDWYFDFVSPFSYLARHRPAESAFGVSRI
jgi:2-hydroxychromene-2-carboxylate isomerase